MPYADKEEKAIYKYIELVEKANKVSLKYFMSKSLSGISEFLFYKSLTKEFFKYSDKTIVGTLNTKKKSLLIKYYK